MELEPLRDAGLTDGEIKVYLALLELGSSTTGPIIDTSGIARSIVYQILEKLQQKGLVSSIVKQKTRYYQAADPNRLLDYLDKKAITLQDNRKKVESLLPELLLRQALTKRSQVSFYAGTKGIFTAYERIYSVLKREDTFYALGVPEEQPEEFVRYWKKDHVRRAKLGIKFHMLFNEGTSKEILADRNKQRGCDARRMPTDIKTPATFVLYADTTLIMLQETTPVAVEIVNQQITDSFKAYFDEFWERSKILR